MKKASVRDPVNGNSSVVELTEACANPDGIHNKEQSSTVMKLEVEPKTDSHNQKIHLNKSRRKNQEPNQDISETHLLSEQSQDQHSHESSSQNKGSIKPNSRDLKTRARVTSTGTIRPRSWHNGDRCRDEASLVLCRSTSVNKISSYPTPPTLQDNKCNSKKDLSKDETPINIRSSALEEETSKSNHKLTSSPSSSIEAHSEDQIHSHSQPVLVIENVPTQPEDALCTNGANHLNGEYDSAQPMNDMDGDSLRFDVSHHVDSADSHKCREGQINNGHQPVQPEDALCIIDEDLPYHLLRSGENGSTQSMSKDCENVSHHVDSADSHKCREGQINNGHQPVQPEDALCIIDEDLPYHLLRSGENGSTQSMSKDCDNVSHHVDGLILRRQNDRNIPEPITDPQQVKNDSDNSDLRLSQLCFNNSMFSMNMYRYMSQRTNRSWSDSHVLPGLATSTNMNTSDFDLDSDLEGAVPHQLRDHPPMRQGTRRPSFNTCTVDLLMVIFIQLILIPGLLGLFLQSDNTVFNLLIPRLFHLYQNQEHELIRKEWRNQLPGEFFGGNHDYYGNDQNIICWPFLEDCLTCSLVSGNPERQLLVSSYLFVDPPENGRLNLRSLQNLVLTACQRQAERSGCDSSSSEPPPMIIVRFRWSRRNLIPLTKVWRLHGRIQVGPYHYLVGGFNSWYNYHYTARVYNYEGPGSYFVYDNNIGFSVEIFPTGYLSMVFLFRDPKASDHFDGPPHR